MEIEDDGCRSRSRSRSRSINVLEELLPPGFRFCPTDEELVLHFLYPKALHLLPNSPIFPTNIIPDILDFHLLHPWELNGKALLSGNQYFLFSQPMAMVENGYLENGYWKEIDDEPIFSTSTTGAAAAAGNNQQQNKIIGVKKLFVFYIGQPPLGIQTNWLMHQYHLISTWPSSSPLPTSFKTKSTQNLDSSGWVLCRVEESKGNSHDQSFSYSDEDELSCLDEMFLSLDDDDLDDITSSKFL